MTIQNLLSQAGFAQMPFRIVPPSEMENILWAGDKRIPNLLYDAAQSPRSDNLETSEFVVLFGEFGSGKTNALKWLAHRLREENQLLCYLLKPSVADKPTWHDIVRGLFTKAFHKADIVDRLLPFRKWLLLTAEDRARAELGAVAGTEPDKLSSLRERKQDDISQEILPECPGFVRFVADLCNVNDKALQDGNWSYLAEKPSSTIGGRVAREYGLPAEGISSDYSATLLLSNFIRLMTFHMSQGVGSDAFYFLMDEGEGMIDLSAASRLSLLQGIRDLFNACTEHLFIALAATASDASEMWGILDASLMQRLSRQPVQFPPLERDAAKDFMLDIMRLNRLPNFKGPPEFPFTQDGLDAYVEMCPPPLTYRKLLVSAQRLLFHDNKEKVLAGDAVDPTDVSNFVSWGMS